MKAAQAVMMALSAALALAPIPSYAQTYPSKPIRVIVTYGGVGEALVRAIGQKMAENIGLPVIVEGQAAAGGAIGAEMVMRAAPDGYTLIAANPGTHVLRQFLVKNMTFDPIKDFTPITMAFEAISVLAVHPSVPVDSIKDFIDYVKRNPGKLSYGTSGIGTPHHMAAELLARATGIDMVHVPYKSGAQSFQDAISGQIQVLFGVFAQIQPAAKAGKLKMLALTNDRRFPPAGGIPPLREVVPGYTSPPFWTSYYGPANVPQPVVRRANIEIVKALEAPDIRSKLTEAGFLVVGSTPEELAATNRADIEMAAKIVKLAGIQPE